jgi:hypothetical protein
MSSPERFRIICYLSWSGVECTREYDGSEKYDRTRTFLDARLTAVPMFNNGEPVLGSTYYIKDSQRAHLEEFAEWSERQDR